MSTHLMSYYLGSLDDVERLEMERQMLSDPEVLLDYFELKRRLEDAPEIPAIPSPALWARLNSSVRQRSHRSRVAWAAVAAAVVVAVSVALIVPKMREDSRSTDSNAHVSGVLFDSGSEQFGHSNVL